MDMAITWAIIGVFVIGFMGVLCVGLAVLNRDLEDKREHERQKSTKNGNKRGN